MKIKHYKILTLLSVGFITSLISTPTLQDVHGALTAPASYDLNYQYSSSLGRFVIGTSSVGTVAPTYSATADGIYTNYSATLTSASNSGGVLPEGLDITMTFNRSNTLWGGVGPTPFQLWRPTDTKIGSDNTVGTISSKFYFKVDNQTNKDYRYFVDFSSTPSIERAYRLYLNGQVFLNNLNDNRLYFVDPTLLFDIYIPSYSYIEFYTYSSSLSYYFDAWYLKDLGVSASYDAGYDAGYDQGDIDGYADGLGNNPNILLSGFQAMVGILVNFMLMILNLEVFGVSILSVFGILALFVGIIWILKIVRG